MVIAPPVVSQSTMVIGALVAAFICYLAINGRLAVYYNIMMGRGAGGAAAPAPRYLIPPLPGIGFPGVTY